MKPKKIYELAWDRLWELLSQETESKKQISHWGPIVETAGRAGRRTLRRRFSQMSADQGGEIAVIAVIGKQETLPLISQI